MRAGIFFCMADTVFCLVTGYLILISADCESADYEQRQAAVMETFDAIVAGGGGSYFPLAPDFCSATACDLVSGEGLPLYFDDNHLSRHGLERVLGTFRDAFAADSAPP